MAAKHENRQEYWERGRKNGVLGVGSGPKYGVPKDFLHISEINMCQTVLIMHDLCKSGGAIDWG